jgi:tryptophan-rich sensory protein
VTRRLASRWTTVLAGALAAAVVATLGASMTDLGPWYQALRKPDWQPPDWLFGPAWTLIFALTALSGITAWNRTADRVRREWIVGLFALNGFLNILWSALFFRVQRPDWALAEVVLFWLSILALMLGPTRHSGTARWLLLPYLLWVSFAAVLNLAIVRANAPF